MQALIHIITDKPFTIDHAYHCSIVRFTVKSMPRIEKTVVNASSNTTLVLLFGKTHASAAESKTAETKYIKNSFLFKEVFTIAFDFLFKCFFHLKIPTIYIGK